MNNITFLIGNGFDLNQGLKTGYKDFYKYYLQRIKKDDIISKSIQKDYELWADLELGLGQLLGNIDETQIDEYFDSKANLEELLIEYLSIENEKFRILDEEKFAKEFQEKIVNLHENFNEVEKIKIKDKVADTNSRIKYQFITFNYTNVLDNMIKVVQRKCKPFSNHNFKGVNYNDDIEAPLHIHGTLNNDLILCVDNPLQIANETLRNNHIISNYMIKSNVNNALGERRIETAKQMINLSRYVCLFGLSIGDTDAFWWKYIIEWLTRHSDNRLVLFVRNDTKIHISATSKLRYIDRKRNYFTKQGKCKDAKILENIQNQIIVVQNSEIFTYKNIGIG